MFHSLVILGGLVTHHPHYTILIICCLPYHRLGWECYSLRDLIVGVAAIEAEDFVEFWLKGDWQCCFVWVLSCKLAERVSLCGSYHDRIVLSFMLWVGWKGGPLCEVSPWYPQWSRLRSSCARGVLEDYVLYWTLSNNNGFISHLYLVNYSIQAEMLLIRKLVMRPRDDFGQTLPKTRLVVINFGERQLNATFFVCLAWMPFTHQKLIKTKTQGCFVDKVSQHLTLICKVYEV